jgi:hypothetical protein
MRSERAMTRLDSTIGALGGAFGDYERAKQVWEILARKQQENNRQTTFPLDRGLLNDLGFTKEDVRDNIRDLQGVLTKLREFTWHWDRRGPLSSKPREASPIAYILDRAVVIRPQFSEVRTTFAVYSKTEDAQPR